MGNCSSSKNDRRTYVAASEDSVRISKDKFKRMQSTLISQDDLDTAEQANEWIVLRSMDDMLAKYGADGTLSKIAGPELLELRTLMDEPYAQSILGKYAKKQNSLDIFQCWIDIQEFKSIPTDDYRYYCTCFTDLYDLTYMLMI